MRRSIIIYGLTSLALTLSACSFSETETTGPNFTVQLPKGWAAVAPKMVDAPDASAAFLKRDTRGGNVVLAVASRELTTAAAGGFQAAILAEVVRQQGYVEEGREEVETGGGSTTLVSYRAAIPNNYTLQRYKQLALVRGTTGYVLTARLPSEPSTEIVDELVRIMLSFTPTDPVSSASNPASDAARST